MQNIIRTLRERLSKLADDKVAESQKRYHKDEIECYGISAVMLSVVAKEFWSQIKTRPIEEIFALCDELWKSGNLEESLVACNFLYSARKRIEPKEFVLLSKWINHDVNNWASCDTLCTKTIGEFVKNNPSYIRKIVAWSLSDNRWVRRASAVSTINLVKAGLFQEEVFQIADNLLPIKDEMVEKGLGWMLKVASDVWHDEVYTYVDKHKLTMSRTALRTAIEKLPKDEKKYLMDK